MIFTTYSPPKVWNQYASSVTIAVDNNAPSNIAMDYESPQYWLSDFVIVEKNQTRC